MRTFLATPEADHVAFRERLFALGRAQRRLSAHDDDPLLVRVVGAVGPETLSRFDLAERRADQLGADLLSHQGEPGPPALAVSRVDLLVAEDVEYLHRGDSQ